MKKQAVATFNNGLNYDLNPITTPNNVLTDNVNGTFITFNGDELALQNDAGNTTITVPIDNATLYNPTDVYEVNASVYITENGINKYYTNKTGNNNGILNKTDWSESLVQLSDGFYPLGIKEYGGVLYIVSAKKAGEILYNAGIIYSIGDVVKYNDIFYNCIEESIGETPYNSSKWELFGDGTSIYFHSIYDLVEFGSYPSMNVIGSLEGLGIDCSITNQSKFYNLNIINNTIFRSGEYAEFTELNMVDTTNLSYYTKINGINTYTYKFYKLRLIQQLENGRIDLTEDVWYKFLKYKQESGSIYNYWFEDENFKYYCPNNFKGKLGVILEFENFKTFKLNYSPVLSYNSITQTYSIEINMNAEFNSSDTIKCTNFKLEYKFNESDDWIINTDLGIGSNGKLIITTDSESGTIMYYRITPIFLNPIDNSVIDNSDIPSEFKNNYILSASKTVSTLFDHVIFELDETSIVYHAESYEYDRIIIKNRSGDYLSNDLSISTSPYYFYKTGTTTPDNWIATYTIDSNTNKVVIDTYNTNAPLSFKDQLESIIEQLQVLFSDYIILNINTNVPVYNTEITVTGQNNTKTVYVMNQTPLSTTHYTKINKGEECTIVINVHNTNLGTYPYHSISDTFTLSEDDTFNYALIGKIDTQWFITNGGDNLTGTTSPSCDSNHYGFFLWQGREAIYTDQTHVLSYTLTWSQYNYRDLSGAIKFDSGALSPYHWYRTQFTVGTDYYGGVIYCNSSIIPTVSNIHFVNCPSLTTNSTEYRNITDSDKSKYIINNTVIFPVTNI